ncbi:MAG: type IV toxin-antitoxin system AbiEi family antitoxin [Acidimicrobiia bacterium]
MLVNTVNAPQVSWARKSSRVPTLLLADRRKGWGVVELAEAAGIAPSYAVKIVQNLVRAGWVKAVENGYSLSQPRELLNSWAQAVAFGSRQAQRRFVVAGDVVEVERRFVQAAGRLRARYALTLFSGARRRAPFVRASVAHAYFEGNAARVAAAIGARPISEGGNLVLVEPDDDAVFLALQEVEGARVVSDARLYVDLYNFEARGREQAEFLLDSVMPDLRTQDSPAVQAGFVEAIAWRDKADTAVLRSEWGKAVEWLEKALEAFEASPSASSAREAQRARLLLWMSLAHLSFKRKDPKALERAREICVTESDVESLRREVGYNATHAGLALQAYFGAQALLSDDPVERRTYAEKERDHHTIITSPYAESRQEVEQRAAEIHRAVWPGAGSR